MQWESPRFVEVRMDAELSSYADELSTRDDETRPRADAEQSAP